MNRAKENTWRRLNGQSPLPTMEEVVASLQDYVGTYNNQHGYEKYPDEMLIDDILYGLGAALSEDYKFADGFQKFKEKLIEHLQGSK